MKRKYCLLISTINKIEDARKLATHLVENHHVACVNLLPGIESIYWWENKVSSDAEILMLMKTEVSKVASVKKAIRELHSYDTPELIVLPIRGGMKRYLQWVSQSIREKSK
jgi:periplasmic divalent cation tolerance protein